MTRHHSTPGANLALSELERSVIENEGDHAIAAGIRVAHNHLGLSATDVALASGLTRTRLYKVLEREDGRSEPGRLDRRPLQRLIGAALRAETPLGLAGFASIVRVSIEAAQAEFAELHRLGVAEPLARTALYEGGPTELWFEPGPAHDDWVRRELDILRWVRQERFSVYIEIPPGSRELVAAGAHHAGPDLATVIPAGTASAVTWDELAIGVGGDDSREALETARDIWLKIWDEAGKEAPPLLVRELLPPL